MQLLTSLTFWRTRRDAQCILTCAINADLKSQPVARMCCQMSRCVAVWIECAASCPEIGYMPWKLCTIPLPVWPDILFLMVANSVCVAYRSVCVLQAHPLTCDEDLNTSKLTLGWLVATFECPSVCVCTCVPSAVGIVFGRPLFSFCPLMSICADLGKGHRLCNALWRSWDRSVSAAPCVCARSGVWNLCVHSCLVSTEMFLCFFFFFLFLGYIFNSSSLDPWPSSAALSVSLSAFWLKN